MTTGEELIGYRLDRAHETLAEACLLADHGRWDGCVNRLYYACFYAVSALLQAHGLSSSKHTGVRSFFNQHFVKTRAVSSEHGNFFNDLFTYRQESDYEDLVTFGEEQVRPWVEQAREFIDTISTLTSAVPSSESGQDRGVSD